MENAVLLTDPFGADAVSEIKQNGKSKDVFHAEHPDRFVFNLNGTDETV